MSVEYAYQIREEWLQGDLQENAGLTTPDDIERVDDIVYCDNEKQFSTLDVYRPKGNNEYLPVIVNVHGGGYVYGNTRIYEFYCMNLAQRGFAVVNYNYRLAPEYKYPSPLIDTKVVFDWIVENKDKYKFDINNCFAVGDSAGAQILSQYAVMYSNDEYAKIMNIYPNKDIKLRAIGLNCGMYRIDPASIDESLTQLADVYFSEDISIYGEQLNVLDYVNASFPPTSIMSAPGDFLLRMQQPMCDLINERGSIAVFKVYGDETIGHDFHKHMRSPITKIANDDQINFFRQYIRP